MTPKPRTLNPFTHAHRRRLRPRRFPAERSRGESGRNPPGTKSSIAAQKPSIPPTTILISPWPWPRPSTSGRAERGIIVCGSGVGVSVAANKVPGIRACMCHDTFSARQGVEDDSMNVLCLGARVIGPELATDVVKATSPPNSPWRRTPPAPAKRSSKSKPTHWPANSARAKTA